MSETYLRLIEQRTLAEDNSLDFADFVAYAIDAVEGLDIDRSEIADAIMDILEREIKVAIERSENV